MAGTEMQLVVPGLIKVGVAGGHGGRGCPASGPSVPCCTPQTLAHPDLTILNSACLSTSPVPSKLQSLSKWAWGGQY